MRDATIPRATYRLQLSRDFTLADATGLIPYLHALGISHVYAAPILRARPGSAHGYDIVDHNSLNPELGDTAALDGFIETLHRHGMGLLLDIVPNHMGVGGDDNAWWLDILEHGEASVYAGYFDIDWHPANPALHNKVLLPFLGDHYGKTLEQGTLTLVLDVEAGAFSVHYYGHRFPVDPRTCPIILDFPGKRPPAPAGDHAAALPAYRTLIADCRSLPRRTELSAVRRQQRRAGAAHCRQRLAALCREHPEIRAHLAATIRQFNGTPGQPHSFDPLHRLLEAQAYRLAYWQVAADEINYRRFFDINDLAGIRVDNPEVFEATHRLIRQLVGSGRVDGLRIDHPDGLSDPRGYCHALREMTAGAAGGAGNPQDRSPYLLVEKILANHESLPSDWPVAGTTGYETAYLINGLFVDPESERALRLLYHRFTGRTGTFDELLYERKKLVIRSALASELTVLANLASSIARTDRLTRDFTYLGLRDALAEVVACFPVYRTYITRQRTGENDRRHLRYAVALAKKVSPAADIQIFDFLEQLLLLDRLGHYHSRVRRQVVQLALRFQQYTAPVMAKGLEDTACYIDNRLVSLNDVGFDPRTFGVDPDVFHHENRRRLEHWPHGMVSTSTHDSKRGEDVRARINVLSEIPREWRRHLARWSRINRRRKRRVEDIPAPARNDEYLLYQTLVGTWPLEQPDAAGPDAYRERIEAYMLKAIREAKLHTSWIRPDTGYEEAMRHFVHALLDTSGHNAFLDDFLPFVQRIARYGLLNGLSQTLLKLTVPGVPDIYQGNELWAFNLVDPDNRRPVDFTRRQAMLQALQHACRDRDHLTGLLHELLAGIEDGRAKLYLTWRTLDLRRTCADVFAQGACVELAAHGPAAGHLCAYARRLGEREIVVVATRWFARLAAGTAELPPGNPAWDDTRVARPEGSRAVRYHNVLTGETVPAGGNGEEAGFRTADLLRHFPVALLSTAP